MNNRPESLQTASEKIDGELYEELLNRYERVLVYAGQLQEQARQRRLLQEKNSSLEQQNQQLKSEASVDQAYIRLLERALESLDILKPQPPGKPDSAPETPDSTTASAEPPDQEQDG